MKVLHITNSLSEGGVETLIVQMLPELRYKNIEVELLVLNNKKTSLITLLETKGIKVHVGKYNNIYNPFNILFICKYFKKKDIIHSHLFPAQYYTIIAKYITWSKIKCVTTEHGSYNNRRKYLLFKILDKFFLSKYDKVVCVSNSTYLSLTSWIGTLSNITVIYNGIPIDKFKNIKPYPLSYWALDSNCIIITMVARFFQAKDHITAIYAMQYLPENFHLFFVGDGETVVEFKKIAKDLKLNTRIHFLMKRYDIPQILSSSNICLLASHGEGLPISILEYMAANKPVIGSDVDGIRDILKDVGLLYKHKDPKDLANKILSIVNNKKLYLQIQNKCYTEIQKYSFEDFISKYIEVYSTLIQ